MYLIINYKLTACNYLLNYHTNIDFDFIVLLPARIYLNTYAVYLNFDICAVVR